MKITKLRSTFHDISSKVAVLEGALSLLEQNKNIPEHELTKIRRALSAAIALRTILIDYKGSDEWYNIINDPNNN